MSKTPKNEEREYVEAVPGPAFIVSKETYERMKKSTIDKERREQLSINASRLNINKSNQEIERNR